MIGSHLFLNALWGGTITALVCAAVGYFMVLRAMAFASEALTDVGFAGIMGSALIGANPLVGMLGLSLVAVLVMGGLQDKMRRRDVEVGMVLSLALGLGVLFLSLYAQSSAAHSSSRIGLFFGSLLHLPESLLVSLSLVALAVLLILAFVSRPLLFASIDPATARARGLPLRFLDVVFLLLLAATTSIAILSMGVLLAFALIAAPAGTAVKISRRPVVSFLLSLGIGLGITWIGLLFAFFGPWKTLPIGVYVAILCGLVYGTALGVSKTKAFIESISTHAGSRLPHSPDCHGHAHHLERETRD